MAAEAQGDEVPWFERGDVIPGRAIVPFMLGMHESEVTAILGEAPEREQRPHYAVLKTPAFWFWVDGDGKVTQIMAWGRYQGRFLGDLRLGCTYGDIDKAVGHVYSDQKGNVSSHIHPGMCFSFSDLPARADMRAAAVVDNVCVYDPAI